MDRALKKPELEAIKSSTYHTWGNYLKPSAEPYFIMCPL